MSDKCFAQYVGKKVKIKKEYIEYYTSMADCIFTIDKQHCHSPYCEHLMCVLKQEDNNDTIFSRIYQQLYWQFDLSHLDFQIVTVNQGVLDLIRQKINAAKKS